MTPTQTPPHRPSTPTTAEPHVWADMTVEVALAVMSGARTARLIIRDADGTRTGLVTRAQLAGFRASPAYTDRVRLSELDPMDTAPRP
ncbi:CBS domain-containing protein [Streptomyces sp. NPDC087218]|uniref:CBS domain-containing protein n=1 Tax=Streptomyces sp. NPDC087218 TaxID=3365769 RepID=UPI003829A074